MSSNLPPSDAPTTLAAAATGAPAAPISTRRRSVMHHRRRARRRIVIALLPVLSIALAAAGYVLVVATAPLPALQAQITVAPETRFEGDSAGAQALVDAQTLPTAIAWANGEVWANDDTAYSMASLSKLVTVLVCLEKEPLAPGADGPTYVWGPADVQQQNVYRAMLGVVFPVPIGTEFTLRQMLQLVLLPSANDFAAAYVNRVFGDNEAFLAAVDAWKQKHGLDSLEFVEPTGMDERNRANAADLARIAQLVLQNPTMLEFHGMQSAQLPWGIGTITNTNPLLGAMPGVIGLKTGTLSVVGYNLVAAQHATAAGRDITNISVTLARPSAAARAAGGREVLTAMSELPLEQTLVAADEKVGTVTTWQGDNIDLVAADQRATVLLPGEAVRRTVHVHSVGAGASGSQVGAIELGESDALPAVPVITRAEIVEPDLWWRITHPQELLGRAD